LAAGGGGGNRHSQVGPGPGGQRKGTLELNRLWVRRFSVLVLVPVLVLAVTPLRPLLAAGCWLLAAAAAGCWLLAPACSLGPRGALKGYALLIRSHLFIPQRAGYSTRITCRSCGGEDSRPPGAACRGGRPCICTSISMGCSSEMATSQRQNPAGYFQFPGDLRISWLCVAIIFLHALDLHIHADSLCGLRLFGHCKRDPQHITSRCLALVRRGS
jgi:hypothetical protein